LTTACVQPPFGEKKVSGRGMVPEAVAVCLEYGAGEAFEAAGAVNKRSRKLRGSAWRPETGRRAKRKKA